MHKQRHGAADGPLCEYGAPLPAAAAFACSRGCVSNNFLWVLQLIGLRLACVATTWLETRRCWNSFVLRVAGVQPYGWQPLTAKMASHLMASSLSVQRWLPTLWLAASQRGDGFPPNGWQLFFAFGSIGSLSQLA